MPTMATELAYATLVSVKIPDSTVAEYTQQMLHYVNTTRKNHKLQPLRLSHTLTKIARLHTIDQAFLQMRFTHRGADGSDMVDRFERQGYSYRHAAENVAWYFTKPKQVFDAWMTSPGHRANILSTRVVEMGMYVCIGQDGFMYWTQTFGRRK